MLFTTGQILTLLLVAIGMALSLAHALEMPGKMRLPKEAYLAVQPIYYPGFTIGAFFGEFGAMLALLALLIATPLDSNTFWLTAATLGAFIAAHGVYWFATHPVNRFWLSEQKLEGAGKTFFDVGKRANEKTLDWRGARKQWEYSHVARAVLQFIGLALLTVAIALNG